MSARADSAMPPHGAMASAEKRWAALAALTATVLLSLPYTLAWAQTPRDGVFMGHIWNPDDPCVYLSWMRQAADGEVFFDGLFTTEAGDGGRFTNVLFLALGNVARLTGLSLGVVYAVARFVLCWALLYLVYATASVFSPRRAVRRLALCLAATSSGLGWLYRLIDLAVPRTLPKLQCVDIAYAGGSGDAVALAMPELNTALSAMLLPLFSASMCLLLIAVGRTWRSLTEGGLRNAAAAGAAVLLLGNVHTYDVIPLAAVLFGMRLVAWRIGHDPLWQRVRVLLVIAAIGAPSVVYQAYVYRTDAIFRLRSPVMLSPSVASYAVSLGLPLVLAAIGAVYVVRRRRREAYPVVLWAALMCLAAFAPGVTFQRKLVEGIHLPLCILAAMGVVHVLGAKLSIGRGHPRSLTRFAALVSVALCLPSTLVFVQRAQTTWLDNNLSRHLPPYYMPRSDLAAMQWLRQNTPRGSVVLSSPLSGAYIPSESGNRVYVGHWADTLDYERKLAALGAFCRGDIDRVALLREHGVRYLFHGSLERGLPGTPEQWLDGVPWSTAYVADGVRVLAVDWPLDHPTP